MTSKLEKWLSYLNKMSKAMRRDHPLYGDIGAVFGTCEEVIRRQQKALNKIKNTDTMFGTVRVDLIELYEDVEKIVASPKEGE